MANSRNSINQMDESLAQSFINSRNRVGSTKAAGYNSLSQTQKLTSQKAIMNQFSQEEKYQLGLGSGQQLTFQTATSDTLTPVRNSKLKFNYTSQLKLNVDDNNIQEASLYVPQTVNITP